MATYLTSNIFSDINITGNCIVQGSLTTGNAMMFRNKLFNGNFQIWQRNTTFTGIGTNTYTADRWVTPNNAGAGSTLTVSRSTNVPSGTGFNYSMQIVTAATTGAPSLIEQRIEAVNVSELVNGTYVTVSFWAIQTSPATFITLNTQLLRPTVTDTFSSMTSVGTVGNVLTGSWAYYRATILINTALVSTNGLSVQFWATAITASTTILIAGIQLEKGSVATPFEFRPSVTELHLCERYYYQLTSPVPGTPGIASTVYAGFGTAVGIGTNGFWINVTFPTTMRSAALTISNSAVSNWQIFNGTSSITVSSIGAQTDSYTTNGAILNCGVASGATAGNAYILRTVALTAPSTAFLGFSCEL
jgi:hypothetical protein